MKKKIQEALKTRWSNQLGIKDEKVFEGVATSVQTLITSDEQLTQFVEGAKDLLTNYQSAADKVRTELNTKIKGLEGEKADLEAKLNGNQPPETKPEDDKVPAWAQALIEQNKTLAEKLTAFETAQSQKSAVAALDELRTTWDYAKGYPDESEYAYNMAMGIYNGIGKTWTAEQLTAKYKETFNERVGKKGVDTTQPFKSDGGTGDNHKARFEQMAKRIEEKQGAVAGN